MFSLRPDTDDLMETYLNIVIYGTQSVNTYSIYFWKNYKKSKSYCLKVIV